MGKLKKRGANIMKKLFLLAPTVLVVTVMSRAQVPSEPTHSQGQAPASPAQHSPASNDPLAPGTLLSVELSMRLDAKNCKLGDKIEARTVVDFLVHGQRVVPRNTKIIGHVTEAKAHSKSSPGSMVGIAFDRLLLKGGREVQLQMTVQTIAPTLQSPAYENTPDTLSGLQTTPGRLAPVGAQAPAGDQLPPPSLLAIQVTCPRRLPSTRVSPVVQPSARQVPPAWEWGIKGLSLDASGPVSVFSSITGNVHLESGTRLTLRVQ